MQLKTLEGGNILQGTNQNPAIMPIIRLQLINEYFYPTDAASKERLFTDFQLERFPEHRFFKVSLQLIRSGFALAISGYSPLPEQPHWRPQNVHLTGEEKPVENPCVKCYLRGLCDDGECGRKSVRKHS